MISGRPAEFEKAVEALTSQGVFVRQMGPNMGAHNIDVMAPALPGLKKALQEVIPSPRRASHRWISTVWSEEEWDTRGRLCSPDYVLTNLAA
ncbi:PREDICTED: fatty acid synthase-like [Priapulus caudatus]|uniref:Fatty acid synthase-like n=1 Tax=Priapulus caudatus TaxID=37621 RepID=A0ABM1FBN5_PRICU|nr:PREDICTED: fatty acid synthase-like [Priapulus caudatus]